jgi:hypothetical protein
MASIWNSSDSSARIATGVNVLASGFDNRDEIVEGTIHLGLEVIGSGVRDTDLSGD